MRKWLALPKGHAIFEPEGSTASPSCDLAIPPGQHLYEVTLLTRMLPPSLLGRKVHGCVQPPFCHLNTKCLEKIALFFRKIVFSIFWFLCGFSFHQLQIWRSGSYYCVYLSHKLTDSALSRPRFQCLVSSRSLLWGCLSSQAFSKVLNSGLNCLPWHLSWTGASEEKEGGHVMILFQSRSAPSFERWVLSIWHVFVAWFSKPGSSLAFEEHWCLLFPRKSTLAII